MRYAFIEAHHGALSITRACKVLQVPRSGFYEWRTRTKDEPWKSDDHLCKEIHSVYAESKGIYGVRKIHGMLVKQGWKINHKRVARLMQAEGLKSRRRRRMKATTDSNHRHPVVSNRLNREFDPSAPNQKWAGDITAVWTQEGWMYLAVVLDLFSRRVIGWALMERMTRELVIAALEHAIQIRSIKSGLVFHSDQGSQYASHEFVEKIKHADMTQSMSRRGQCYDNAVAESFFASYKLECVPKLGFVSQQLARDDTFEWIEVFYNRKRLHSTLGYITPVEAHARVGVV